MTGDLFEELVKKLDSAFYAQNRKVVFLVENCPAHPPTENLTNVKIIIFYHQRNIRSPSYGPGANSKS